MKVLLTVVIMLACSSIYAQKSMQGDGYDQLATYNKKLNSYIGTQYEPFRYTTMSDEVVTNDSIKGKVLVIDFWFMHCAGCVKELDELNKLHDKLKERKDIEKVILTLRDGLHIIRKL